MLCLGHSPRLAVQFGIVPTMYYCVRCNRAGLSDEYAQMYGNALDKPCGGV